MIIDDLRRTVEGLLGTLTPTKAQQLAKDMLEPGAAKEQVAKATADLLEWSQGNRERISGFMQREISEQLKSVGGVASQAELDALKKRVRDLERAAGMTASGEEEDDREVDLDAHAQHQEELDLEAGRICRDDRAAGIRRLIRTRRR